VETIQTTPPTRIQTLVQSFFAGLFWLVLVLPYVRRVRGLEKIRPGQKFLFVCNHVSLLDTIFMGAILWRHGHLPMLVLGDKDVWSDSWLRRTLSRPFGWLLERGKFNPRRIRELQGFGRAAANFQLVVFPEGTRGNGVDVAECQPGIYYIAQAARVPIVPVYFSGMEKVSTKKGRFHLLGGLRRVEIHFGEAVSPDQYLDLERGRFAEFIRGKIRAARG
jgi:1-acyl-sn-glycerol-3-phosphate acyltransferase